MSYSEPNTLKRAIGRRYSAPAWYMLALAAFFFTFFNLRCGTSRFAKVSGIAMATGSTIKVSPDFMQEMFDENDADSVSSPGEKNMRETFLPYKNREIRLPVNYWLLGALLVGAVAFIFSFIQRARTYFFHLALGGGAILLLIVLLFTKGRYALRILEMERFGPSGLGGMFGEQVVRLETAWGFWLALSAFAAAFLSLIMRHAVLKEEEENWSVLEEFNPGQPEEENP